MAAPVGPARASPAARGSRAQIGPTRVLTRAPPSGNAARSCGGAQARNCKPELAKLPKSRDARILISTRSDAKKYYLVPGKNNVLRRSVESATHSGRSRTFDAAAGRV
jgi:hypothetical protein